MITFIQYVLIINFILSILFQFHIRKLELPTYIRWKIFIYSILTVTGLASFLCYGDKFNRHDTIKDWARKICGEYEKSNKEQKKKKSTKKDESASEYANSFDELQKFLNDNTYEVTRSKYHSEKYDCLIKKEEKHSRYNSYSSNSVWYEHKFNLNKSKWDYEKLLKEYRHPKKVVSIFEATAQSIYSFSKFIDKDSGINLDHVIEEVIEILEKQKSLFKKMIRETDNIKAEEKKARIKAIEDHFKPRLKEMANVLDSMEEDITLTKEN